MDTVWKWVIEKGPIAAVGTALLLFVVFHIVWTATGNRYQLFDQNFGAPPPTIEPTDPPADNSLPLGAIVAFFPTAGGSVPEGWAVCDGLNGTPDLRAKFIQGVSDVREVGDDPAGSATHNHTGATGGAKDNAVQSTTHGSDDLATTFNTHTHALETSAASHIPPNFRLLYIMKIAA